MANPSTRFTAVAITRDGYFVPFGPTFETENAAWGWLHFQAACVPEHKEIEVYECPQDFSVA